MLALADPQRLSHYFAHFRPDFRRRDQASWAEVYVQGLMLDLPRKTIETLARHVILPPGLVVQDLKQALQNFVNQSPWDEHKVWRRYRTLMVQRFGVPDGVFVIDEAVFAKQGRHSVGVQRQYSDALGAKVNCQIAVGVHYVSPGGYCPLILRLYLPRSWLHTAARLDAAAVPPNRRQPLTKGQIALDLLDEARAEGFPGRCVLAGPGYGASAEFREALNRSGLSYLLQVSSDYHVLVESNRSGAAFSRPEPIANIVRRTAWEHLSASKGPDREEGWFAWQRVRLSQQGAGAPAEEGHWLLMEQQANGATAFALSNLGIATTVRQAVPVWRRLHLGQQGAREFTDALGLQHFEGRSWRGFHHHACLAMLAFGALLSERSGPSIARSAGD